MRERATKEGYKIPEGYFEKSKSQAIEHILELENHQHSRKIWRLFNLKSLAIAASIGLAILVVVNDSNHNNDTINLDGTYVEYLIEHSDSFAIDDLSDLDRWVEYDYMENEELLIYIESVEIEELNEII